MQSHVMVLISTVPSQILTSISIRKISYPNVTVQLVYAFKTLDIMFKPMH